MKFTARLARHHFLAATAIGAAIVTPAAAHAQDTDRLSITFSSQPLGQALRELAIQSGRSILVDSTLVRDRQAPPLRGSFTIEQALAALLRGSGLEFAPVAGGFVITGSSTGAVPPQQDQKITVTGTRIAGAAPAGAELIVLDRDEIDRSGYATTQQLLQSLPQNFGGGPNDGSVGVSIRNNATANSGFGSSINLRGLGSASTLVLIDGHRLALGGLFGAFADLSLIPSTAIERIEILGDGASAIYGSDAVAGVVNIRLRNDFKGAETRARYGFADGFDEAQASQLLGFDWGSGHLTFGYEFYQRGRLHAEDRDYATEDLRRFGGPDYRKNFSNPGTIIASDGSVFAIPRGQDGTALSPDDLIAGEQNLYDGRIGTDLLPKLRRHAGYVSLRQDLAPWLTANVQGFVAARNSSSHFIPDNYGGVVVPPSNPFYVDPLGTGQPIIVNYDFTQDLGQQTASTRVRAYSGIASLDATLGAWSASLHGTYGLQSERLRSENLPNYYKLAIALSDPDPATAYNLFGDGSHTNPATLEAVRGYIHTHGRYRIWATGLKLDGPLFGLPAGDVKLAVGGEYRREHYSYDTTDYQFSATPTPIPTSGLPISRGITAGFAELHVPMVGRDQEVPGVEKLDLSLAGRVEHYSDFGTTTNPKVGVSWTITDGVIVRGTFGTSFRAPSFQDVRQGPGTNLVLPQPLADPESPIGTSEALILFGNRPGIGPERARTWTAGLDLRPAALPGLHASATYFDIRYRDRITSLAADYLTFLTDRRRYGAVIDEAPDQTRIEALYADPTFANPYGIPAADIDLLIDARTSNLSSLTERGLDFDIGYRRNFGPAQLEAGVSGTTIFAIEQQILSSAPATDVVSTIGNPVDLRLRGRLVGSLRAFTGALFVNYIDGYRNSAVTPAERVRSWTTFDLQMGYEVPAARGPLAGLRFSLSVTNLFDRDPPYVNNPTPYSAAGFDPANASAIGRLVALQVIKTW